MVVEFPMKKRFEPILVFALTLSATATVPACGGESLTHGDSAGSGASVGAGASGGSGGTLGGGTGHVGGTSGTSGQTSGGSGGASVFAGGTGAGAVGGGGTRPGSGGRGGASAGSNATSTGGGTAAGGANANGGAQEGGATDGGTSSNGGMGEKAGAGGHAGTSGTAGTSGNTNCIPNDNRTLVPSATGWVDHQDACNDVGVQGPWYPYGDQYGNGSSGKACLINGQHQPSECALITTPDPSVMAFENMNGLMTTAGVIEQILPCVAGSLAATIPTDGCPGGGVGGGEDYSSMWGAGIAFDFNRNPGPPNGDGSQKIWNPYDYDIIGIQFTIANLPPGGLRVEFPMQLTAAEAAADTPPITAMPATTDYHSRGAPYWGAKADGQYPNSPVVEGINTITWDTVGVPIAGVYTFDVQRILGIKFHLQAHTTGTEAYGFTIRNLTFLRHL
jgi:hypothetical protein